jgi:pimeloyl-ACP methyl ester carboxylesterase
VPSIRGVELAVTDSGTGPAVFWGHGLSSSVGTEAKGLIDWDRLGEQRRIIRWDARGHGESGGTLEADDYRWDHLALDLVALADELGVERFVVGGTSMGAATALHAAVVAPERVAGLVLALAPTAYDTRAAQAAEYRAGADLAEREGIDAYTAVVNAKPPLEILGSFAELFQFSPAVAEELLPTVLRGAASSDLPDPDAVRSIAVPVLLLAWAGDPGHPVSTSERLAELLPHADLHVAQKLREVGTWTTHIEAFLATLPW